jgi:hypothetical protein
VSRPVFAVLISSVIVGLSIVSGSCGTSEESLKRAAQSGAEKYLEFVKAEQYAEAYRRALSSRYRQKLTLETFELYRGRLTATTGRLKSVTLVKAAPLPESGIRLTYALEGDRISQPAYEILDMRKDGDDWKVDDLDMAGPGSPIK